jgi:hypothetical protein
MSVRQVGKTHERQRNDGSQLKSNSGAKLGKRRLKAVNGGQEGGRGVEPAAQVRSAMLALYSPASSLRCAVARVSGCMPLTWAGRGARKQTVR